MYIEIIKAQLRCVYAKNNNIIKKKYSTIIINFNIVYSNKKSSMFLRLVLDPTKS